uniref:Elongin-A n=1 Tax=Rhinolophus ferrumequinum TaxID=59479 RepID=A0A671F3K2_RHIFE
MPTWGAALQANLMQGRGGARADPSPTLRSWGRFNETLHLAVLNSRLLNREHIGSLARDLVAHCKKVPVEGNTDADRRDSEESESSKCPRDSLQEKLEMEGDQPAPCKEAVSRPAHSSERRQKKHGESSELERPHRRERREGRTSHGVLPADSSKWESSGDGWSPPSSTGPHQTRGDHHRRPTNAHMTCQRPGEGHTNASRDRRGPSDKRHLGTTQGRGAVSKSEEHPPSHKDKCPGAKGREKSSALISQRSHQVFSRKKSPRPLSWEGAGVKLSPRSVKEKEGEGRGFQFSPPSEMASDKLPKKRKSNHSEKTQSDKDKRQHLDSLDAGKRAGALLPEGQEKVADNLQTQEGKVKTSHRDGTPAGSLPDTEEAEMEEEFEPPTMPFEAYLTYDQPPRKKKKKIVKISSTALEGKGLKKKDSKSASENLDSVQELPKVNANKSEKPQLSGAHGAKLKKVPADASSVLPDLWLPRVQPGYRPLPAFELMSSSQLKQRAEEEEAGFATPRVNSKMQVFSGSKWTCLRKMMTLRQQCILVLRNNLNSLLRVGGVPYSVLQPVLESCTPDQLYRLEKYNCVLVKETDQLWKLHCHRYFKKEKPEELESWREMYLRLQDARQQRLRALTLKIRSAQASRPKGRQTKMIVFNSFERGGAALQEKGETKPAPYPTASSRARSSSAGGHGFHPTPEKLANACPSTSSVVLSSSRKPAKPIAPMMAKTIKDFKNRYFRR